MSVPLFDGKLYSFPLFNTKTYYLRNKKLTDGKVCLARTFNLKTFESRGFDELKAWLKTMPDMSKAFKAIAKLGEYETSWNSKKDIFVLVECESDSEVCCDYVLDETIIWTYDSDAPVVVDSADDYTITIESTNLDLHGIYTLTMEN